MVINITFLLRVNTQIISFLKHSLVEVRSLAIQIFNLELHHHSGDVFVDLFYKGGYSFCFGI
jgi:hypothetical protein